MAKRTKTIVDVYDDLDDQPLGEAYETIRFAVDGRSYEFDTSPAHAAEFRDVLARYIGAARPVARTGRRKSGSSNNTPAIRSWAQANGYNVSDRGRIPADVIAAYEAAN